MLFKNSSLSWFVGFLTIIIDNNVFAAVPNLNITVQNIANKRFPNMFLFCLPVVMIFCIWLIFAT